MSRTNRSFSSPGRGKDTVARFKAFLAAFDETFDQAAITVDWFHVVQMFTKAVDDVRRAEAT